jgi:2-dehydro-3-deoxyphosphooctonate aldolase (KDO 8-P synthase)
VPVLTDVHEDTPLDEVASVVDVLQTPAFLCRQTNFIQRVARPGRPVNIKKGQFLAPWDMGNVVDKARATGNEQIMVCERGVSFGYNTLVSDMRSLGDHARDRLSGRVRCHALGAAAGRPGQQVGWPARTRAGAGARGGRGRGRRAVHGDPSGPERALSDGPNSWPLDRLRDLLETLVDIDRTVKAAGFIESDL